jgi:glycosyltransferase involved in cell wall biosynthesis
LPPESPTAYSVGSTAQGTDLPLRTVLVVVRWPVGGIRTFIRYVYPHFTTGRFRFVFYLPQYQEYSTFTRELAALDAEFCVAPSDFSLKTVAPSLLRIVQRRGIDLIHAHGLTSALYVAPVARLTHTPHLATLHDVFREPQFGGITGQAKRLCIRFMLPLLDTIHCVSHDVKANLDDFFPRSAHRKQRDVVISNGIDSTRFLTATSRDLHAELGLSSDCAVVGFFGRFMSQKGFATLVDAVYILSRDEALCSRFRVLTFEEGAFFRHEVERIARLGLSKFFCHLPFTPDISSTLKGLDLVVVPSLWEASSLVSMEAMTAGVPVIGSDCIGLREVLRNTPCTMFPTGDAAALADAIHREILSPTREQARAFTAVAAQRFDVRKRAAELEQVVIALAERRQRRTTGGAPRVGGATQSDLDGQVIR